MLQAVKLAGLKVLVCDIEEEKLAAARDCGADFTANTGREDMRAAVEAHFPGGADIIVDAVGTPALLEQSIALAAPTARVAVIGFSTEPARIPPAAITKKELTIVGSRMNQGRFPQVMEWFGSGELRLDRLISKRYPLKDIQQAFEETLANGQSVVKTIIEL